MQRPFLDGYAYNDRKTFVVKCMLSQYLQKLLGKHPAKTKPIIDAERFDTLKSRLQKELFQPVDESKAFFPEEAALIKSIRTETAALNRNNITRTQAYLAFYNRNPEVHWAFLAHMVSRNGGYHMTDLKSSNMTHLLDRAERQKFFLFLERANSAIFADAFPQLLLYEHSKQKELPLRRYLPVFRISRFMAPIWESFIEEPHSPLLTTALIINEQRMLQERILKRTRHGEILRRLDFQLQEYLGFMKVIFPYANKQKGLHSLTGLTVERFADPKQRIETGKLLYGLLFQHPVVFRGVGHFTKEIPHTGSREDYWASIYTSDGSTSKDDKIYSPTLHDAWKDQLFFPPHSFDWFTNESYMEDLRSLPIIKKEDLTNEVLENVKQLKTLNGMKAIF
ncbi:DUF2515 family protein [Peribacillus frigoritolerans]|uniref:DUF2515 family protein n=1 Tax=Peribacillus frigoritolerans TaxID=450367 RepID=UPI002280DE52|nr:DUF2515 family protein [Peribacillus frigoritolerans]MCY8938532.1 DUF2515 domain-containing protein [Peribacillus frigoritolerans]